MPVTASPSLLSPHLTSPSHLERRRSHHLGSRTPLRTKSTIDTSSFTSYRRIPSLWSSPIPSSRLLCNHPALDGWDRLRITTMTAPPSHKLGVDNVQLRGHSLVVLGEPYLPRPSYSLLPTCEQRERRVQKWSRDVSRPFESPEPSLGVQLWYEVCQRELCTVGASSRPAPPSLEELTRHTRTKSTNEYFPTHQTQGSHLAAGQVCRWCMDHIDHSRSTPKAGASGATLTRAGRA